MAASECQAPPSCRVAAHVAAMAPEVATVASPARRASARKEALASLERHGLKPDIPEPQNCASQGLCDRAFADKVSQSPGTYKAIADSNRRLGEQLAETSAKLGNAEVELVRVSAELRSWKPQGLCGIDDGDSELQRLLYSERRDTLDLCAAALNFASEPMKELLEKRREARLREEVEVERRSRKLLWEELQAMVEPQLFSSISEAVMGPKLSGRGQEPAVPVSVSRRLFECDGESRRASRASSRRSSPAVTPVKHSGSRGLLATPEQLAESPAAQESEAVASVSAGHALPSLNPRSARSSCPPPSTSQQQFAGAIDETERRASWAGAEVRSGSVRNRVQELEAMRARAPHPPMPRGERSDKSLPPFCR